MDFASVLYLLHRVKEAVLCAPACWYIEHRDITEKLLARGWMLGFCGWDGTPLYFHNPTTFRRELERSFSSLKGIFSPGFYMAVEHSLTRATLWAVEVMAQMGIEVSLSVDLKKFNLRGARRRLYVSTCFVWGDAGVVEVPSSYYELVDLGAEVSVGLLRRAVERIHGGVSAVELINSVKSVREKLPRLWRAQPSVGKPVVAHLFTWAPGGGGVDRNIYHSVVSLAEKYHSVVICGRQMYENVFEELRVPFFVNPFLVREFLLFVDLRALLWFWRHLMEWRYHIVHTHESKASVLGRVAAWLAGLRPIIYGVHGVSFDAGGKAMRWLAQWAECLTFFMNDVCVAVGRQVVERFWGAGIGRRRQWVVVRSPVDEEAIAKGVKATKREEVRGRLGVSADSVVLLCVSRFERDKRQEFLIRAMAQLRQEKAVLVLVGGGFHEYREACRHLAGELGVAGKVLFVEETPEPWHYYAVGDVFVFASVREGVARVLVEAHLAGLPIVATEACGVREVVEEGVSGFVVGRDDLRLFVARLQTLINDEPLRKQMGRAGYERVRGVWSVDNLKIQLDTLYSAYV